MTQSSWSSIVARAVSQVSAVAGIGNVHEGHKLLARPEDVENFAIFEVDGERRFRMWTVQLGPVTSEWEDQAGNARWSRLLVVEGMLQFEDGSEATTVALAEKVMRTLNADVRSTRLNGLILYGGPCVLRTNEPRMFGMLLAHFVRVECPLSTLESLS